MENTSWDIKTEHRTTNRKTLGYFPIRLKTRTTPVVVVVNDQCQINSCQLSGSGSILIIIPAGCFRENPSTIGKFNSITGHRG